MQRTSLFASSFAIYAVHSRRTIFHIFDSKSLKFLFFRKHLIALSSCVKFRTKCSNDYESFERRESLYNSTRYTQSVVTLHLGVKKPHSPSKTAPQPDKAKVTRHCETITILPTIFYHLLTQNTTKQKKGRRRQIDVSERDWAR